MKSRVFLPIIAVAVLATGCLFSPDEEAPIVVEPYPENLSHPDSVMKQFIASYVRRDIENYATLLSRRFEFHFTEGDATDPTNPFGAELTFEQDSLVANNIFNAQEVLLIRLDMTWSPTTEELWEGELSDRAVLTSLQLDLEQSDGNILRVLNNTQHFYFQLGREEDGEDPTRYYIRAWRDIGAPQSPKFSQETLSDGTTVDVITNVTMGQLRLIMSGFKELP